MDPRVDKRFIKIESTPEESIHLVNKFFAAVAGAGISPQQLSRICHGFAPYTKKRRKTSQVTENTQTTATTIPPWNPPKPTPHPQQLQSPTPMEQSQPTTQQPSDQTPAQSQPPNTQTQAITPLMSITFTPHTIRQIKSRLNQRHTPAFQPPPPAPPIQHLTHLLHTIQALLTTLCNTIPTYSVYAQANTSNVNLP